MGGEGPSYTQPGSETGGVKPMSITGRMVRERERLEGMTKEERAWRKQWLKDQVLTANEPKYIKQLESEFYNPIRRAYRFPLNFVFHRVLEPAIGYDAASVFRFYTGRAALIISGFYAAWYLLKYNHNTWMSKSGWRVIKGKQMILPGEPGFGEPVVEKQPNDYNDRGFKSSVLNKHC